LQKMLLAKNASCKKCFLQKSASTVRAALRGSAQPGESI
jgi:hypothetical protein